MAKKPVKYFTVDAFSESAFKGNPAAVCLLEEERDEEWLQSLAAEFNISETCFLTRVIESETRDSCNAASANPGFRLRWFTPTTEVKLCGHATLASAHALFSNALVNSDTIEFLTHSGTLTAKRVPEITDDSKGSFSIELNFPMVPVTEFNSTDVSTISKALNGASIIDLKRTAGVDDLFVVLPSWESVTELEPNLNDILRCPGRGVLVSAKAPPGSRYDFCSRFFCPKYGINEDPVCGSAHCALAPYWSEKLDKCDFTAYVASRRGGTVRINLDKENQKVLLRGKAVTVTEGYVLV